MPDTGVTEILVSTEQINETVKRLGAEITECYKGAGQELIVIGLLRGSFIFST